MAAAYVFERKGRSLGGALVVAAIWLALAAAWVFLDAAPVILGIVALLTLPAIWDMAKNPSAGLHLTEDTLSWYSSTRTAKVTLREINMIRLNTRLDFSVRATVVLHSGRKITIPFEATPPHQDFENALTAKAIKTERHHFSLMQ